MDESLRLRILSIFITLLASMIGVFFPIYISKNLSPEDLKESPGFGLLRSFSAGIMVGVAFIHLLADAASTLLVLYPTYPAFPYVLVTIGIVFVLALENFMIWYFKPNHTIEYNHHYHLTSLPRKDSDDECSDSDIECNSSSCKLIQNSKATNGKYLSTINSTDDDQVSRESLPFQSQTTPTSLSGKFSHRGRSSQATVADPPHPVTSSTSSRESKESASLAVAAVAENRGLVALTKAYLMELAIAIHSVIIGVSMGMMGPQQLSTLRALIVAMVFHQFFEGLSLGTVLSSVTHRLGTTKTIAFATVFSTTLSLGIAGGMVVAAVEMSGNAHKHDFVVSCANAVAAGTLIYVALVEMVAEEFGHHHGPPSSSPTSTGSAKHGLRLLMVLAFALGLTVMTVLGLWA